MSDVAAALAAELKLRPEQIAGAIELLKHDMPLAFIARYRREKTGGLDEERLAVVNEHWLHRSELEARRAVILNSIKALDKLDNETKAKIEAAATRADLEDLYLPFAPKGKKNRGLLAAEKGLGPLADLILQQETTTGKAEDLTLPYLSAEKNVKELAEALTGARDILADRFFNDPRLRSLARRIIQEEGKLSAKGREKTDLSRTKYASFAEFSEPLHKLPPHRIQALLRGEEEKKLQVSVEVPREKILDEMKKLVVKNTDAVFTAELVLALEESLDRMLLPHLKGEVKAALKTRAELHAAELFAKNLHALLLQAPLGTKKVLSAVASGAGADGKVQFAMLDSQGKLLGEAMVQPWKDDAGKAAAAEQVTALARAHAPEALAIGNGDGGRETEDFVRASLSAAGLPMPMTVFVTEAGAAAYATGRVGKHELPDAEGALRATIFIGRRLQDPLAELVKLDPRTIGVGQYQHDADARVLRRKLDEAVASCVARVGVDINTASTELLYHVAGIGEKLAGAVVETRNAKGGLSSREDLKAVPGLGEKEYMLAAGFLRVKNGVNPLDATAIHPERYALVEKLAVSVGTDAKGLLGNRDLTGKIDRKTFLDEQTSEETLRDMLNELREPGHDPRGAYQPPAFNADVKCVADLKEGQVLGGVVTNITAFGVFVDLGVRQDGLVHISELSHRFIKDPAAQFTVGQAVKVKVLSVEPEKKRISLSVKALETAPPPRQPRAPRMPRPPRPPRRVETPALGPDGQPLPQPAGAPAGTARVERPPRREYPPRRREGTPGPRPARPGQPAAAGTPGQPAGAGGPPRAGRPAGAGGASRDGRRGRDDRGSRRLGVPSGPRLSPTGKPLPDYSKFFVKGGKKKDQKRDKDKLGRRDEAASRQEVREVIKTQESRSKKSLADLLKGAGVEVREE